MLPMEELAEKQLCTLLIIRGGEVQQACICQTDKLQWEFMGDS